MTKPNIIHPLLHDESAWELLLSQGYLLIDANLERETILIREYILKHFQLSNQSFYYSLLGNDFQTNQYINLVLRNLLSPLSEKYFQGHRTITGSFLAKPAQTVQELLLHQDWCYTDESKYNAFNVWVPLTDINENNGALCFLPGSHKWFQNYRSGSYPTARIGMGEVSGLQTIYMKRGQVLIFHPAVFHGSYPNLSNENRIVATTTLMDKEAPFLYYHQRDGSTAEVFMLDDEYLLGKLGELAHGGRPEGKPIENLPYIHTVYLPTDMNAR